MEIKLETFGDLHKHGYRIDVHCRLCRKTRQLDLAKAPQNRGYIGARFRCTDCGSRDCGMSLSGNSRI